MFIDQNLKSTFARFGGADETSLLLGQVEFRPSEPRRRFIGL
jgi:hypothetical protein